MGIKESAGVVMGETAAFADVEVVIGRAKEDVIDFYTIVRKMHGGVGRAQPTVQRAGSAVCRIDSRLNCCETPRSGADILEVAMAGCVVLGRSFAEVLRSAEVHKSSDHDIDISSDQRHHRDSLHAPSIIAQQPQWRPSRHPCGSLARVCDVCDKSPPPMARSNAYSHPRPPPVKKCRPSPLPRRLLPHRRPSPLQMPPQRSRKRLRTSCRNGGSSTLRRSRTRSRSAVC